MEGGGREAPAGSQPGPAAEPEGATRASTAQGAAHADPVDADGGGGGAPDSPGLAGQGTGALPSLPAPGDAAAATVIEVNGKAVMLDTLGPMVVGRDGSLSRIANWGEMTEIERQNTLRILGKRNQLRLGALRAAAAADSGADGTKKQE